jgi:acyl-CoA thioesterase FadM
MGTTSFTVSTEMRHAGDRTLLATTETTYVHVDPKSHRKRAINADMRAALEEGARGKTVDHAAYLRPCGAGTREG